MIALKLPIKQVPSSQNYYVTYININRNIDPYKLLNDQFNVNKKIFSTREYSFLKR